MIRALIAAAVSVLLLAPAADATTVVYAPCPGNPEALGCLDNATDTIYVAERGDRNTLLHEQGHVFDRDKLNDRERRFFARLVGMRGAPWWGERSGDTSPAERFADAYSLCHQPHLVITRDQNTNTAYGYWPWPGRHRRICNAIAIIDMIR